MMADTRKITLKIGDKGLIPVAVPKDPQSEKLMRRGADEINRLLERYVSAYPKADEQELMTYVALHLGYLLASLRAEVDELALSETLESLIKEMDDADKSTF